MTDDGSPDLGDLVADPARPRRRRTWPERLSIVATFATAALCLITAFALVSVYLVVRQKNVVELEVPAAASAESNARPVDVTSPPTAPRPEVTSAITPGTTPTTAATSTTLPASPTPAPSSPTSTSSSAATAASGPTSSTTSTTPATAPTTSVAPAARTPVSTTAAVAAAIPETTFPPADPAAKNFLITGADNGACIDPDSPYAAAFGDRDELGERSDTIMVVRVDPRDNRVAVLSFPRDLWVEIAGSGSMRRINSAYKRNEPQRLVDTLYDQFGISIDHYIQFDFCAFKTLVDAVGGVDVPFEHPARDTRSGLFIDTAGCVNLGGEAALAYVRSRYFEYDTTGEGDWRRDRSSDLGRISRQQDFIRRTLATVSGKGLMNPDVVRGMLRAADRYIVTDRQLTPRKILEFAGVMRNVDPDSIMTYQIAATPRVVNGNDVLIPNLDGELMRDVLALFRGELSLGDAPAEATVAATTPQTTSPTSLLLGSTAAALDGTTPLDTTPHTTVDDGASGRDGATAGTPVTPPVQDVIGIVPAADEHC